MHRMVANWKNPRIMDMVDFYYLFNYLFTAVQGNIRPDLNVQRLMKKSKLNVSLNLHNVVTTKTPSHIGGGLHTARSSTAARHRQTSVELLHNIFTD